MRKCSNCRQRNTVLRHRLKSCYIKVQVGGTSELSFDLTKKVPLFWNSDNSILKLIGMVLALGKLDWAVAPADERSMHKYNGSTYEMDNNHNPNEMEGSTTYTLPYWMGRYHGMLK